MLAQMPGTGRDTDAWSVQWANRMGDALGSLMLLASGSFCSRLEEGNR
jgi:hypothetical protein